MTDLSRRKMLVGAAASAAALGGAATAKTATRRTRPKAQSTPRARQVRLADTHAAAHGDGDAQPHPGILAQFPKTRPDVVPV
jgi:secreted PhoX family phosphatase